MGFLNNNEIVIDAVLTRKGRELLARNDGSFKITKFSLSDDEINYQLYDANSSDPDADILKSPILEPISNENVAMLYKLITLPNGSVRIATLNINPSQATIKSGDAFVFTVNTLNGDDPNGWVITSRNDSIGTPSETRILPVDGVGTGTILTGVDADSETGLVIIDIVGMNSAARASINLTVTSNDE